MMLRRLVTLGVALLAAQSMQAQRVISVNFASNEAAVDDVDEQIGYAPVACR